jgi:HSP20 family protein
MSEEKRRYLRDVLDEFDRYFDEFEKHIEEAIRTGVNSGQRVFSRPVVTGMAMGLSEEGRPAIHFFGDNLVGPDGFRSPIYEQVVDEKEGKLRVLVELPGVEKGDVQVSAVENSLSLKAEREGRKYKLEVALEKEIDPDSGTASYRNGLLEISFNLREKTNKAYRRVTIV